MKIAIVILENCAVMLQVTNQNFTVARPMVFQSISTNNEYDDTVATGVASTTFGVQWCTVNSVNH